MKIGLSKWVCKTCGKEIDAKASDSEEQMDHHFNGTDEDPCPGPDTWFMLRRIAHDIPPEEEP